MHRKTFRHGHRATASLPTRRWTILGVWCLPLVPVIAATVLNVALPELTEKLHPSVAQSLCSWMAIRWS